MDGTNGTSGGKLLEMGRPGVNRSNLATLQLKLEQMKVVAFEPQCKMVDDNSKYTSFKE